MRVNMPRLARWYTENNGFPPEIPRQGCVRTGRNAGCRTGPVLGANDRIRIGIIGAGDRGMELVNHIRACSNAEIVGFADVYSRRLEAAARLRPARRSIAIIAGCWTTRPSTR